MRSEMIYGNPPTFEEIMQAAKQLEDEFNVKKWLQSLKNPSIKKNYRNRYE